MGRISAYFSYVVLVLAVLAQPASAVVIKGYDSARMDGEYGLTGANLTTTVGYITDPANFGPGGISPQAYQVGGAINVATAAMLAGTDVFFTGWVPTSSRTVTHMSDVLVYDGGADGDGDTQGDNTLFAWEGIFTP